MTAYDWIHNEKGPRVFVTAVGLLGTKETPGPADNPTIIAWARTLGFKPSEYPHDSTPWCGLGMAYIVKQSGFDPPPQPLWALNWKNFGHPSPMDIPMLGDIMVKTRHGGGHVTMYAGEDKECYHCIGCNQSDSVSIERIAKSAFSYFRRCPWRINQPPQVRRIFLDPIGVVNTKED